MQRRRAPVADDAEVPTDPAALPDIPGMDMQAVRDAWGKYSPEEQRRLIRSAQDLQASLARYEQLSDTIRRQQQAHKNQAAVQFFTNLLADERTDPDQVETLALLQAALPEYFA